MAFEEKLDSREIKLERERILLSDPLCDQSRRERLTLLALSIAGIAMGWARQMPTAFSVFGFEAEHLDPRVLVILGMLAIALFPVSTSWTV